MFSGNLQEFAMGKFQLKEGLFEYSTKRLPTEEREDALRRIEKTVPLNDDELKRFMNIGNTADSDYVDLLHPAGLAEM
jgi:hypothetical protein